ncbi:hypothetical protein Tco_0397258 [Tanacetum coccineum]
MESVKKVVLESRHWLHDGDLFQGVEKFNGVDSPFVPYLDCCFLENFEGGFEQDILDQEKKKNRDREDDE